MTTESAAAQYIPIPLGSSVTIEPTDEWPKERRSVRSLSLKDRVLPVFLGGKSREEITAYNIEQAKNKITKSKLSIDVQLSKLMKISQIYEKQRKELIEEGKVLKQKKDKVAQAQWVPKYVRIKKQCKQEDFKITQCKEFLDILTNTESQLEMSEIAKDFMRTLMDTVDTLYMAERSNSAESVNNIEALSRKLGSVIDIFSEKTDGIHELQQMQEDAFNNQSGIDMESFDELAKEFDIMGAPVDTPISVDVFPKVSDLPLPKTSAAATEVLPKKDVEVKTAAADSSFVSPPALIYPAE